MCCSSAIYNIIHTIYINVHISFVVKHFYNRKLSYRLTFFFLVHCSRVILGSKCLYIRFCCFVYKFYVCIFYIHLFTKFIYVQRLSAVSHTEHLFSTRKKCPAFAYTQCLCQGISSHLLIKLLPIYKCLFISSFCYINIVTLYNLFKSGPIEKLRYQNKIINIHVQM